MGVSVTDATHAAKDRVSSGTVLPSGKSTSIIQASSHGRNGSTLTPMPDLDRRPAYRLTQAQAADLLGVSTARVAELGQRGAADPGGEVGRRSVARLTSGCTPITVSAPVSAYRSMPLL